MRETRYLWVKNFPDNIQEDKITDYFKRYGRIERVKVVPKRGSDESFSAIIAFVDIRSAQHAQSSLNTFGDRQLQITYSDPAAMSSMSSRRGDQSPSSSYRPHSSHRSEVSRSFDGHSGERAYSSDRHRSNASPSTYKSSEYGEIKSGQKRKDPKNRNFPASSKVERKTPKLETVKLVKKKNKKQIEETKPSGKVTKMPRPKEFPATKKKVSSFKKKVEVSSSDDDDDDSSSTDSDESSQQSSTETTASSYSSSSSNSDTSSSRSSIDSNHDEQKLVTIIIKKLPSRPSVNNLRDGIYHEFKKCGKVKSVVIRGDNNSRNALVLFRNASEANKAIGHAKTKLLFGAAIEASLYDGEVSGKELQECGGIIDEFHPRASRTLFVGNLDKTVQYSDIQNIFVRFGDIVALDIKKMYNVPQYAFLQYTDIASVVKAIQKMDGELLGRNVLKLGFGKTVMSSCVWVEGVTDGFTEHYLASCFHKHGSVKRVIIDRTLGQALVFYPKYEHAQKAINSLRGRNLNGSRLKLDYASHELVEVFLSRMQRSGQAVTTFESIRHLLLPTPSGPGIPSSTPASSGSRSVRSGSTHPYPARGDPYYEGMHPSRYHPPPHGYDAGLPPRSDWRSWDERSRGRPVYQSVSPRGRRYNDDRGEYYHREAEHFERVPGRYEQDYRGPDYIRKEEFSSRPYGDDYHRSMKPREHHEPYHVTPPSRVMHRRSRSISPRLPPSSSRARGPEFDSKSDLRSREHRDHSLSRGRSPIKSPGSKEGRMSGPALKFRDHPSHSPNVYPRRDDERRVEMRDPKSLPGSPRSVGGSMRGKAAGGSPDTRSLSSWSGSQPPPQNRHDVELLAAWDIHSYERSRSETPTRDENTATIGEVIIKQPTTASVKQEASRNEMHEDEEASKKKKVKNSQDGSPDSSHELFLQRKYSLANEAHKKKKADKEIMRDEKHKKQRQNQEENEKVAKKSKVSAKEEKHRKHSRSSESKAHHSKKPHNKHPALIKREYSPSSVDESGNEQKRYERRGSKQEPTAEHRTHRSSADLSHKRQDRHGKGSTSELDMSTQKKRKHSQTIADDSDHSSPFYKSSSESYETKLKRSYSENSDELKSSKRSRKSSALHEAPIPVASQSFMCGVEEDSAASIDSDAKEPSAEFRPKVEVREEIIEVEQGSEEEMQESTSDVPAESKEKKSRWEVEEKRPKVAIAQPFHVSRNPLMTSELVPENEELEITVQEDDDDSETVAQSADAKKKLSRLEEEKAQLQALLTKLDSKQELAGDEVSQVADIYMNKLNSKHSKTQEKSPKSDESSPLYNKPNETTSSGEDNLAGDETVEEVSQTIDIPEMIEEQTIVEEEVTSNDEMVYCEAIDVTSSSPPVPSIQEARKNEEAVDSNPKKRTKTEVSKRDKEKQQRSLLRKQKKERERHKRKVDKMRGPSQSIISSIVDEESLDDSESLPEFQDEIRSESHTQELDDRRREVTDIQKSLPVKYDVTESKRSPASNQAENLTSASDLTRGESSKQKSDYQDLADSDSKTKLNYGSSGLGSFAIPLSRDNSTPGSTPKSTKTDTVSPGMQKVLPSHLDEGSRTSSSPFTPKSAAQLEKMSQSSGRSSNSLTPLTPSPKTKLPTTSTTHRSSSKHHGDRKSHDEKRKKSEQSKPMPKQDDRHWKMPTHTRHYTNLTVPRETDHSRPLDKKELERLCIEVAKVKKELDREMAQGFLSPSAEGDSQIPPMSPILKSPSIDVTSDVYGKSGTSPIITSSPSAVTSQSATNASSLTERLKLLGKVKKKFKVEEEGSSKKPTEAKVETSNQDRKDFGNSRFFKSNIFDQDSQRLSHLQMLSQSTSSQPQTSTFPTFDSRELPEDKPLFSDIAQKSDSIVSYDDVANHSSVGKLPKNESSLSTDITHPAHAESKDAIGAGIVRSITPSDQLDTAVETTAESDLVEASTSDSVTVVGSESVVNNTEQILPMLENTSQLSQLDFPLKSKNEEEADVERIETVASVENISDSAPSSQMKVSEPDEDGSAMDEVEMSIDDVSTSALVEVVDQVLEADVVKAEDDSMKESEEFDVLQPTVSTLDTSAGDVISLQDICDLTDVATTEVVSTDPDFVSPEIADDLTLTEVVAQDTVEEMREENPLSKSIVEKVEEEEVASSSVLVSDNSKQHKKLTQTADDQVLETSKPSIQKDDSLPTLPIELPAQPKLDTLTLPSDETATSKSGAASSFASDMLTPKPIPPTAPSSDEQILTKSPLRTVEDPLRTIEDKKSSTVVVSSETTINLTAQMEAKNQGNCEANNVSVKKLDASTVSKVVSRPVSKLSSEGKEKKSTEKKFKMDKAKKEKKDEKKLTISKVPSSKSDKSSLKTLTKSEKSRDKTSSKKVLKEEKIKVVSSMSNKPKSSDGKSAKSSDPLSTASTKHDATADDKHRKKEVKPCRKSSDNAPQLLGLAGVTGEAKSQSSHSVTQKPLKVSEKTKTTAETDKKEKTHKQDSEKKKELKQKHTKEEKASVHKKLKDDTQKEKTKQTISATKKHSLVKEHGKKDKQKMKDSLSKEQALKMDSKSKLKTKTSKTHLEVHPEPAKKKLKLDESVLTVGKQKPQSSMMSCSDSDFSTSEDEKLPRKHPHSDTKAKMKQQSGVIERKVEKSSPAKAKPKQMEQKSAVITSDSESSDNFDKFISQLSGGTSKSTLGRKAISKPVYSSCESSDAEDKEAKMPKRKTKVKKLVKPDRYDSDKSDHSAKKQPLHSKTSSESSKNKLKSKKTQAISEKSNKKVGKSSGKSFKSTSKDKKLTKVRSSAYDSGSDDSFITKAEEKKALRLFRSDNDDETSSSDEEEDLARGRKSSPPAKKKSDKIKKSSDLSHVEGSSSLKGKKSKLSVPLSSSPDKKSEKNVRKISSSSSSSYDSSDYTPPPLSSSLLTVETIKDETVIPSKYRLESLNSPEWQHKSSKTSLPPIYTSSSSSGPDSDLDENPFQEISTEDKKRYFGSSGSSEESEDQKEVFSKLTSSRTKLETKFSSSSDRQEKKIEKDAKSSVPPHDVKNAAETDKSSKATSKFKDSKKESKTTKHLTSTEKTKQEHKQKSTKKEEKTSLTTDTRTIKEKPETSTSKIKSHEQRLQKKIKLSDEKQRKYPEHSKHTDEKLKKPLEMHKEDKHKKEKIAGLHERSKGDKSEKGLHEKSKGDKSEKGLHERSKGDKSEKGLHEKSKGDKSEKGLHEKSKGDKSDKGLHEKSKGEKSDKGLHEKSKGDKSDKGLHEKSKGDKTKSESVKPHSKTGYKEKKGKSESSLSEKNEDRPKFHKEISKVKHKSKDHSHVSHSKDQLEKKDSKTSKDRVHDPVKIKKETKGKIVQERNSGEQKTQVMAGKVDKKKIPKPKPEPAKETGGLVLPSVRVDKEPEMGFDEPGRSFFYSDSSDEEKKQDKRTALKFPDSEPKNNRDANKQSASDLGSSQPSTLDHSSSSNQKSLFSPTKDDHESSSSFEDIEQMAVSPSDHSPFGSSHLTGSPSKELSENLTDLEKNSEAITASQSTSENLPTERTKRLSSYEKYKMEQERRREHIKELKKLSQQRDEEAVRSIMAGDVVSDDTVSDNTEYGEVNVVDTGSGAEVSSTLEEQADSTTGSTTASLHENASESGQAKNPTPEPRSLAEEDELAAALRSIEGFGDFHSEAKTDLTSSTAYEQPAYEQSVEEDAKDDHPEPQEGIHAGAEEAASAASALLEETTSLYEKRKETTLSNEDYDAAIQLPSVRYEDNSTPRPDSSKALEAVTEKSVKNPDQISTKNNDCRSKTNETKHASVEEKPKQMLPDETLTRVEPEVTSVKSGSTAIQSQEKPAAETLALEPAEEKKINREVPSAARSNESSFPPRPFVSLSTPREQSNLAGSSVSELKTHAVREVPPTTQPPLVSRRPSSDLYPSVPYQSRAGPVRPEVATAHVPAPSILPPQPIHRAVAPIHEVPMAAKMPQPSPTVTAPPSRHIPPNSKGQISPNLTIPVSSAPNHPGLQERPQIPAHPMHRLPQQLPMYHPQSATSHPVPPQANLKRADSSGQLRSPHISGPAPGAPSLPPMAKASHPQPYQPPSMERPEKPPASANSGVTTFYPPISSTPSSHEPHKELVRGAVPAQTTSTNPQMLTHFSPHQSMYYHGQNIPLYPIPHGLPFARPQFARFNVPLPMPHSIPPQPQQPGHMFHGQAANPYADLPQGMLASQRLTSQSQEPDRPRQHSPSRGVVRGYSVPISQDYQANIHPLTPARPTMATQEPPNKSPEVRLPYANPSEGAARPLISMAGDPNTLLDQHFKMSGFPATSSVPSLPTSGTVQIRSVLPGPGQHRAPGQVLSSIRQAAHPHMLRPGSSHLHPETYRQPSAHLARDHVPPHLQSTSGVPQFDPPGTKSETHPTQMYDSYQQRRAKMSRGQGGRREEAQQDNLQDLFKRYPVIWQGKLALKNDFAAVQIHFVAGNLELGQAGLPQHADSSDDTGMAELRIVQRMRTNAEQMNSLRDRMKREKECSFLLALPCGRDRSDVVSQTKALRTGFIQYLQQKEVAGIVNVEGSFGRAQSKLMVVLHVFPPSEFTSSNLQYRAPDLLSNVADIEHLLIVVTPA